jgi:hypothetical protein
MKRSASSTAIIDGKRRREEYDVEFEEMMLEKLEKFNKKATYGPINKTIFNRSDCDGRTFVHKYAANGKLLRLRWILDKGAEIDPYVFRYNTATRGALHIAIAHGNYASAKELLRKGASLTTRIKTTPLECAVVFGNPEMIQLLFDHGAKIDRDAIARATKALKHEVMDVLFANGLTAEYLAEFKPMRQIMSLIHFSTYNHSENERSRKLPLHLDMLKTLLALGSHIYEPNMLGYAFRLRVYDAIEPLLSTEDIEADDEFFKSLKPIPCRKYLESLRLVASKRQFLNYRAFDERFRIQLCGREDIKEYYKEFIVSVRYLQSSTLFEKCALKIALSGIPVNQLPIGIAQDLKTLRGDYNNFC